MQVKLRGALTADDGGFTRFARVLEGRVGASGWFVGDRPTAADIRMFTQVREQPSPRPPLPPPSPQHNSSKEG